MGIGSWADEGYSAITMSSRGLIVRSFGIIALFIFSLYHAISRADDSAQKSPLLAAIMKDLAADADNNVKPVTGALPPFCEIEKASINGPRQYLQYGNEENLCVNYKEPAPTGNDNVTYCMCREFPGFDKSGLCANETTEDGIFRPYCLLEYFNSGLGLGGPPQVVNHGDRKPADGADDKNANDVTNE